MQRHGCAIHSDGFAVVNGLDGRFGSDPRAQQRLARARGQISFRAGAGVIGMRVRDNSPIDFFKRVDMEVAGGAI